MSPSHAYDNWRELAVRETEGLQISLLWSKSVGRVKVAVADTRPDEVIEFEVAGTDALAAFYHPFAHAAAQGLVFGSAVRESLATERRAA